LRIERRPIPQPFGAWLLSLVLIFSTAGLGQTTSPGAEPPPQGLDQNPGNAPPQTAPIPTDPLPLPDSPGATPSRTAGGVQALSNVDQQAPTQQNGTIQRPLGTAAAGMVSTSGVAASRPEGAALAPAKQRRVRLLMIKLGVVAAGAVAPGATLALASPRPRRPSGSH
jgi:hypothetical protein